MRSHSYFPVVANASPYLAKNICCQGPKVPTSEAITNNANNTKQQKQLNNKYFKKNSNTGKQQQIIWKRHRMSAARSAKISAARIWRSQFLHKFDMRTYSGQTRDLVRLPILCAPQNSSRSCQSRHYVQKKTQACAAREKEAYNFCARVPKGIAG